MEVFKYLEEIGKPTEKKGIIIKNHINELIKSHDGQITPQMIVDAASEESHPLHDCFEWDDSEAARKYRLIQAMNMILSQKFVVELKKRKNGKEIFEKIQVRRLLPGYDKAFKGRVDALSDEETRKMLVERKKASLRSWCTSVVDIEELNSIRETIMGLIE